MAARRDIQASVSQGLTCVGFAAITLTASDADAQLASASIAADATKSTTVVEGATVVGGYHPT